MNKNDNRIIELKKKIGEKKSQLGNGRFTPVTNCNLTLLSVRYNLHALGEDKLQDLLIDLHIRNKAVKELELEYALCGYEISDWMKDIKSRLAIINRVEEERKLKAMEAKLDNMLSDDKKIELELDELIDLLN